MKHLYIIRHAKAEEHSFQTRDYDRNLTQKGKDKAQRIVQELAAQLRIDEHTLALSSSANRAIQTAEIFCGILGYPIERIQQDKQLYMAFHTSILETISQVPNHVNTLLVFGHNPGVSMLVDYICDYRIELKTSDTAYIEIEEGLTFAELSRGTAHLKKIFE